MEIGGVFLKRAAELQTVKPLAAYHCKLYAVQCILEKGAHLDDPAVGEQIGVFLNEIELLKPQLDQEIINDRQRAFDYMFGFASSVFKGGFNQIQAHSVTKSTILEFKAALDFLKVLNLWPDLVEEKKTEIDKMVKYSKFHLARILKAFKANEDPNDYITPDEETQLQTQAFVPQEEEAKEETSLLPNVPSDINENSNQDIQIPFTDASEINLPKAPENIKGELALPTAPVLIKGQKNKLGLPTAPGLSQSPSPETEDEIVQKQTISISKPPPKPITKKSDLNTSNGRVMTREEVEKVWKRDEVIAMAQKKAKFAIGALNYEDIETAVNELTQALNLLKSAQ